MNSIITMLKSPLLMLQEKSSWSKLRRIGHLKIVKLTILAPFVPFVFSLVNFINDVPNFVDYIEPLNIIWPNLKYTSLYFFYWG